MTARPWVWLGWALATTAAFAVGVGLSLAVGLVVGLLTHGPWGGAAAAAVVAFVVAAAQYAVARRQVRFVRWTFGASLAGGVGWLLGQCAALPLRGDWSYARAFAVYFVIGAVVGAAVGVAQTLAMRTPRPLGAVWVAASALGWGAGLAVFACGALAPWARMAGVAAPGVITATALVLSSTLSVGGALRPGRSSSSASPPTPRGRAPARLCEGA